MQGAALGWGDHDAPVLDAAGRFLGMLAECADAGLIQARIGGYGALGMLCSDDLNLEPPPW